MNDEALSKTGIAFNLWHCDNPGVPEIDATEAYLDGTMLLITSSQERRTKKMAWLAQHIGDQMNHYYRLPGEHKRSVPTPPLPDGFEVAFPFIVRMIGVRELVDLFVLADRDIERNFAAEICEADFYFLTELGDEIERPSTFSARVVKEFFNVRDAETLPTVVSLAKPPSKVHTSKGDYVYADFSAYLEPATKLVSK